MNASQGMVAALAALFAVIAKGGPSHVEGFKSYATPAYTIVTHDEVTARRLPQQIAMMDAVLAQLLMNGKPRIDDAPTYIVAAPVNLWADYLEPCGYVCGEFVAGRFVNYVLISNTHDMDALRGVIRHEYTHLFLHTQFRGIVPRWFDEGVALLLQHVEFRGTRALIGGFMRGSWMPLNQALRLEKKFSPEFGCGCSMRGVLDPQTTSLALVYRGLIADPPFGTQMFSYLDAINDLQPVDQAVQSSFGMSVAELDKSLFYWGGPAKTVQVDFELPEIANPSGRSMTEFDSLAMLADAMFASEFKRARTLELINAAQRIAPNSAGVRVLRLRLAARDREDAAIDWLLDKLEPSLPDPQVARGVGVALFERVRARQPGDPFTTEKTRALQQRALDLLDRSLRAQPDDPEAAWAFGMLAASANQLLGSALQRLLSASERFPMSADIAMATALVYESLGKPEKMIAHLRDTERFARSVETRAWAKRRIDLARRPGS